MGPAWQQHGEGPAQPCLPETPQQPSHLRAPPSAPSWFTPTPHTPRTARRWQLPATREHLGCRKRCSFKIWLQSKLDLNQQGRNPNNLLFSKLNTGLPELTTSPPWELAAAGQSSRSPQAQSAGAGQRGHPTPQPSWGLPMTSVPAASPWDRGIPAALRSLLPQLTAQRHTCPWCPGAADLNTARMAWISCCCPSQNPLHSARSQPTSLLSKPAFSSWCQPNSPPLLVMDS